MSRVITFSRVFPSYHPKAGQPTHFVDKIWNGFRDIAFALPGEFKPFISEYGKLLTPKEYLESISRVTEPPKHHTIRAGKRWRAGDKFSPRVWSGKPYNSKQITIAPDIELVKVWDFEIKEPEGLFYINGDLYAYTSSIEALDTLAANDGLNQSDLMYWFRHPKPFSGQILCWSNDVNY